MWFTSQSSVLFPSPCIPPPSAPQHPPSLPLPHIHLSFFAIHQLLLFPMSHIPSNITSWNANSLQLTRKNLWSFTFKNHHKIKSLVNANYIICIQESRLSDHAKICLSKNYPCFFSNTGDTTAGGLTSIIPMLKTTIDVKHSNKGRYLAVTYLNHQELKQTVINAYGDPQTAIPRKMEFLNELDDLLDQITTQHPNTQIYLAGDFNIGFDETSPVTSLFKDILDKHNLTDIFRTQYPDYKTHPGHTRFPFGDMSGAPRRIDGIFIHNHLLNHSRP